MLRRCILTSPSALPWHRAASSSAASWRGVGATSARKRCEEGSNGGDRASSASSPVAVLLPTTPAEAQYAFAAAYCFTSTFGREQVASAFGPVIPTKILEEAAAIVASDGRGRHGDKAASLLDQREKRCVLCQVSTVDTGHAAHSSNFTHQARLGVVERAVALVNWHLHLLSQAMSSSSLSQEKRQSAKAPAGGGEFSKEYVFAPGTAGLPPLQTARRAPQSLKEVDWAAVVVQHWWGLLDIRHDAGIADGAGAHTGDFNRIPSLSCSSMRERKWRMRYVLRFLMQRGVVRDSLQLSTDRTAGLLSGNFTRTARFERCEMIGDSVVKYVIHDRLLRIFPVDEGGLTGQLGGLQQVIDSNPGLLAIYDYLELDSIVGTRLPNTKAKADVIEALFGELQTFLLASETMCGVERYPVFLDREQQYVRKLVEHALQELAHVVIMWRLEETVTNARAFIEANTIEPWLVKLRGGGNPDQMEGGGRRGRRGEVAVEESIDRRAYDPLPLLTDSPRPPPHHLVPGKETWYHAKYVASTKASAGQEILRGVNEQPISGSTARLIQEHYRQDSLRVHSGRFEHSGASGVREPPEEDGNDSSKGPGTPQPSLGSVRFPRWREDADARERLHHTARQLTASLLCTPEEVADILDAELQRCTGTMGVAQHPHLFTTHPDFTAKPQTPLYTTTQGERLVLQYTLG